MRHAKHISTLLLLTAWLPAVAQQIIQPRSPLLQTFVEEEFSGSGLSSVHHNIRPFVQHAQFELANEDFLRSMVRKSDMRPNRLRDGHFFEYRKKWFGVRLNPIYHSVIGYGSRSGLITDLFGGLRGDVMLTPKLTGSFSFKGGAFRAPAHVEDYMDEWGVRPGYGDMQRRGELSTFFLPTGSISYSPSEHFNVQAGHDRLFIGNGYRSLLLSDNAPPYSFLKLDTRFWKVRYVNIFANFKDIRPGAASRDKLGTFHYLSLNVGKRFTVGLFESIIWQARDSSGTRGFEANYINPIIFYRPVEMSLRSPDNVILGLDVRFRIGKNHHLYAQLLLDEMKFSEMFSSLSGDTSKPTGWWGNKQGFQVGLKGWSPFGLKNLYYQTEFNWVRPFTYTHYAVEQNFGHYNQPLAHPMGANFMESVSLLRYRRGSWMLEAKFIYSNFGLDTGGVSYGQNIYRSYGDRQAEYGNTMVQGLDTKAFLFQFRAEYVVNPFWDLRIMAGLSSRSESSAIHRKDDLYVFFGISTDLTRPFDDF
ncbi:MAG: hypothetical protein K9J06_09765 [Flavobacteriales bacterium]|nr:hypothetical protein [Flavobacteriales bacterium]